MKQTLVLLVFIVVSLGFAGCAEEQYAQGGKKHSMKVDSLRAMKTEDVVALSKAGVSDSLIIGMMDATDTWFQLKTQDVINLRNAGVSEKVIVAMMQQPPEPSSKTSNPVPARYYVDPWFYRYDGFYPSWYYPTFSVGIGYRSHHFGFSRHGRFR